MVIRCRKKKQPKWKQRLLMFFMFCPISPFIALAAGPPTDIQSFGTTLISFLNSSIVPFLFSIALLVFIFNTIRYAIFTINKHEGAKSAKNYMLYSIGAFVLMVSVWGIVNLFAAGSNLDRSDPVCPDAVPVSLCNIYGGLAGGGNPLPSSITPTSNPGPTAAPPAVGRSGAIDPTLVISHDASLQQVISELGSASFGSRDAFIDILNGSVDTAKIPILHHSVHNNYIELESAQSLLNDMNSIRAHNGQTQIIVDLSSTYRASDYLNN